jgi:hypothetical protein
VPPSIVARPNRQLIMDDLVASLQAISVASGYKTTAVTVERRILSPPEVPVDATPWYGVVPMGVERITPQFGGMLWCDLGILVTAAVALPPGTESDRSVVISDLLDDVKYALCGTMALSTRGTHVNDLGAIAPNAVMTRITDQWADEEHEVEVVIEHDRVIAWVAVRATVTYQQERGHA